MPQSLFERLGGRDAVGAAVDIFYQKVLDDDRVNHFFNDIDMDKQKMKQRAFLTVAFGGPNHYTGKDLRKGHAHLLEKGLNDSHVDIIIEHLGATLKALGVNDNDIAEVASIANSVRADILNR